jgi:hypothetical protein
MNCPRCGQSVDPRSPRSIVAMVTKPGVTREVDPSGLAVTTTETYYAAAFHEGCFDENDLNYRRM